jgi:hypothetical protein
MDASRFRAWICERQGLAQTQRYVTPVDALIGAGWQRSVGGVTPYLALRARTGAGRADVDALAAAYALYELPSARSCTYVLPAAHYAFGLAIAQRFSGVTEIAVARKLGVPDAEIATLKDAVVDVLTGGPLSPADMKAPLGDRVRNLGDEGKKRGLTTTLPLALSLLQTEGRIRRRPVNGRFDAQRYTYEVWSPPLDALPAEDVAIETCVRCMFGWAGAATIRNVCEFTALGVRAITAVCERIGVSPLEPGSDLLALPDAKREWATFVTPAKPAYRLVGNIDSFFLLRHGDLFWLDASDGDRMVPSEKGAVQAMSAFGGPQSHAILDRGRLIGLWDFDADEGQIVSAVWAARDDALEAEIAATEEYVRNELGDARSFSLDSPASRRPRLDGLRALQADIAA